MIKTKIIATLGPASDSTSKIAALIEAGVDVFRLNFSHGTLEQHGRTLERVRSVCRESGAMVAVMADLCGPKIRVDPVEDDAFDIDPGDHIYIMDQHVVGTPSSISTNHSELVREVEVSHRVLIDDGSVCLRVKEVLPDRLHCVCEIGGKIGTRKGINVPDSDIAMSALTEKDKTDLAWATEHGVDFVALSFVRSARDLQDLMELMPLSGGCPIVAKIETAQAMTRLDEIIEAADVVLIARGDLGVEMDLARVPLEQKEIARLCQQMGKPVIVATQMLQSMVHHPTATRAEVSDVANAILDSADCVMLSAETSVGEYPVESVRMLGRVAAHTEEFLAGRPTLNRVDGVKSTRPVATAVSHGASVLARELKARVAAVWTDTGNTARLLSKCRLEVPVIGLSPNDQICRRMAMYYGVIAIRLDRQEPISSMLRDVDAALLKRELVAQGDLIVAIAGTRLERDGSTNALFIHLVAGETPTGA